MRGLGLGLVRWRVGASSAFSAVLRRFEPGRKMIFW